MIFGAPPSLNIYAAESDGMVLQKGRLVMPYMGVCSIFEKSSIGTIEEEYCPEQVLLHVEE